MREVMSCSHDSRSAGHPIPDAVVSVRNSNC